MNNFWWNKYIGIPYKMMGCSMEGCDCWGLVRLVYKNEFGIDIPSVTIDMTDHANMELIPMGLDAMWDKTDNPQPGDVINFHVLGHDQHVGIVTAPGQMLHVFDNGHTSCIETYTSRKWKNRIAGIYTYAHAETLVPENEDGVSVIGKPHPLKPRITTVMPAGRSLEEIITTMCDEMGIPERFREYGAACVNLTYVPRDRWATTFPKNGDTVIFRLRGVAGGGGGGFFGSILGIVAIVAAAALTWWAGGSGAAVVAGWLGVTEGVAAGLMAVTALGLTAAGMALLNNSIAAKPSMGSIDSGNFVDAKFLSGGNNSTRPYETIPQVLGIGRMTFDYLCKPYTEQADRYTNYLRVAFTAGYGPVEITNIRNGDSDIEKYNDVQCNIYTGYGNDQTPKIYTADAEETSINITLGKNDHNYRTTVDDVDQIQVVLYWPQGLWYRNNRGDKCNITSTGIIRYRAVNGEWNELHKVVRPYSITFSGCAPLVVKTTSTHSNYSSQWYNRYGNTKYTYSDTKTYTLYRWYTVTVQQGTCNIRNYGGGITDRMYDVPSDEYWNKYLASTYSPWEILTHRVPGKPARLAGVPTGELLLAYVCVSGNKIVAVEDKRTSSGIEGCGLTTSGLRLDVAGGTINNAGVTTWNITKNNELRAFTQVYTFNVSRGQYEIDVQLTSADDEEKAGWDAQAALQVQWLVMRTFTFRLPFTPRKPLAWLEMRIRATDQISGSLDEINGMVASIVKDYDYETDTWVERASDNPASLFRHVLQGPAIPDEYRVDDAHIDLEKLKDWHNYCRIQGFSYFRVLGADSGMSVYEVLTEIAAAGYAKPVLKPEEGGIWSVWIDEPQTTVMQHFTEHNTWGVQWTKKTIDIPHAIRATFVNKDKGYEQDTVTVYVDGHDESNSTKFENWGVEYFQGITDIKQVQRVCRRAMAFAKLRPETLSFMCAMEYVTSQVGDLVRVTNSFVQWGLGSGWIVDTIKNSKGVVGLVLSESVTLTANVAHSIRVRRADAKGTSFKADIATVSESKQTNEVMFTKVVVDNAPAPGDLYQFGYKDKESHECIITAIEPESGDIARITVCDYSPELFDIDDGPIPDYDAGISRPPSLPTVVVSRPVFVDAMSDEQVLLIGADGSLIPRLAVVWARPEDCQDSVSHIQFRYRTSENGIPSVPPTDEGVTDGSPQEPGSWYVLDYMPIENTTAFITPVTELYKYDVEARFLTRTGITGQWTKMIYNFEVIGKTSLPPAVDNFRATIKSPLGILLKWDKLDILDIAKYKITGDASVETVDSQVIVQVSNKTGNLIFNLQAVDTGGRMSATAAVATVNVKAPKVPDSIDTETRTDGLYLTWDDCDTTWPVRHYLITDEYLGRVSKELKTQFVVSPRAVGTYEVDVQAVDIFDNYGKRKSFSFVVQQPSTPQPKLEIANGVARVSWKAVSTSFPIKTYQVYDVNGQLLQETASTFYDINGPAGVLEYRIRAVDTAGNMSAFGEFTFALEPPEAPQVTVALNRNKDGLDITWNVPDSVLPVITYDIVRQWDETLDGGIIETKEQDYGSTDATALAVPAIPANTHTFMVRAVDASGNRSSWGTFDLAVRNPGPAFLTDVNVIDNNVMIYWQEPNEQFFAIQYYNFGTVEDGYFSLIGRIDARFASRFEKQSGAYTYQVCPVDVAGNIGQCSNITAQVAQPPDFVFFDDKDSTFNGTKVNSELDGVGNMIMGVYPNETWNENTSRVAALLNTSADTLTWQQKINGGYPAWQSPVASFRTVEFDGAIWANIFYHYLGSDGTNLFLDKNDAANCGDIGDDRYSRLIVLKNSENLFRQSDGKFEFIMFQSDETGPFTGDGSVYSRWKQTDNPMTTLYPNDGSGRDPVAGFESVEKVGTSYPYGLALSSSANTLLDGQPKHSNWFGAVGQVAFYNGVTPALTNNLYSQLWVKIAPSLLTGYGSYVEIVDVGTLVPATSITVTTTSRVLEGSPILSCKIEVKGENEDDPWREMADGAFFTYATSFRYVRYTFTVTGGMLLLSNINYRLDVKKLSDFGSVYSRSTDNGAGFVDVDTTPMLYGTWVPFSVSFTDVQSGPMAFCNEQDRTAYVVFEDVLKPKGFRVFVLDKNGNRTSGQVSWSAHGV